MTDKLNSSFSESVPKISSGESVSGEEREKWLEARRAYLAVEEEIPRIVVEARQELDTWRDAGGRITYGFRRDSLDIVMEKIAAIVYLADELAKRPKLKVTLYPPLGALNADSPLCRSGLTSSQVQALVEEAYARGKADVR